VAFEDPDGAKVKALLAERYLYAFGNRAAVKKWKYRHTTTKEPSKPDAAKHDQGSDTNNNEDVELTLSTPAQSAPQQSFMEALAASRAQPSTLPQFRPPIPQSAPARRTRSHKTEG